MPASRDRLTTILRITHQRFNKQPKGIEFGYSRGLGMADDEAWVRDAKVSETWLPLELGWCSDQKIAHIVIANVCYTDKTPGPKPIPQEVGNDRDDWLEVKYEDSDDVFFVPLHEALPITPSNPLALRIRVRKGSKRYRIFVVPE